MAWLNAPQVMVAVICLLQAGPQSNGLHHCLLWGFASLACSASRDIAVWTCIAVNHQWLLLLVQTLMTSVSVHV